MIHVRNMKTPTLTAAWSAHATTILAREFLKLAGWTDQSINTGPIGPSADAAWASCLKRAANFDVAAGSPLVIYDPAALFDSSYVGLNIFVNGTLNKGAFQIVEYVDSSHVKIDAFGAPPGGWVDETGIACRVINVNAARLAAAATFLSQAPTGNNQARASHATTSSCLCYARPKGGAALATEVPSAGIGVANGTDTWLRFHAVLDAKNVLIWWTSAFGFRFVMWGELSAVDTGDSNPGFIWSLSNPASHVAFYAGYMLNHLDVQIAMYPTFMKSFTGDSYTTAYYMREFRRLQNGRPGKLALRVPKICLDNVSGCAVYRGKLPIIRFTNYYMESYRPLDAAGSWLFTYHGLVSPRNGPSDPLPILGG